MRTPALLGSVCILTAGCATRSAIPAIEPVRVEGSQVQVDAVQVHAATLESVRWTVQSSCDGPCDRLYVDAGLGEAAELLFKIVEATAPITPRPQVYVLPPSDKRILLDLETGPCEVDIAIEATGIYVSRGGERLEPDSDCRQWDATVCRADDGTYDWPRLRSLLGDIDRVCLAPNEASLAEIAVLHETLHQPAVRLVRSARASAPIGQSALAAAVKKHGADLQWCLDGEVVDEPAPVRATIRFVTHIDGTVTRAEVLDSSRATPQFDACVADVVAKKFRFDPPDTGEPVVVELQLDFQPGARRPQIVDAEP